MNRLQKKCFVAATGMHLLLVVVLVVGPGFLSPKDDLRDLQVIDVIPANLIEQPFAGGGQPKATPPPPVPRTQPQPPPPKPTAKVEPEREPPPPKPKATEPDPVPVPKKHTVTPNLTPTVRKTAEKTPPKVEPKTAPNQTTATDEKLQALARSVSSLRESLSPTTSISVPGPGGEAYAGYDIVVQSVYQKRYDQELPQAGDIADRRWEVEVSVTIARSGDVVSSRITKPSGNPALNKLVQRVLDRVTFIAPFPPTSKDSQRTFTIIFDLKPRKALG